jgi:tight adherence protein C
MLDIGLFPSICIVATISSLVWLVLSRFVVREEPDWHDRLKSLVTENAPREAQSLLIDDETAPKTGVIPALSSVLQPKDKIENQALAHILGQAGFNGPGVVHSFLAFKLITMCVLGVLAAGIAAAGFAADGATVGLAGMTGVALGMFLPLMTLRWIAKGRREQIQLAIPGAVDLLVIALEAGIAIDQAMNEVAEEMKPMSPALAVELEAYTNEMRLGGNRAKALHNLGTRSGVDDLNAMANVLLQADRFGTAIAQALKEMARVSRQKRRQRAEERASKTAVTLLVPLILFIFPGIFVILVGPAGITIFRDMVAM